LYYIFGRFFTRKQSARKDDLSERNGKMDSAALAQALWADIGAQRWDALAAYFLPGALIFWHNTDECFTVPTVNIPGTGG